MVGVIGDIVAIIVLVVLAWRRWNGIVCALIATLIAGVANGFGVWGTFNDYWLPAASDWMGTFVLMFLTSAMYAKVLGDSGAANRIAVWVFDKAGEKFVIPVLVLISMVLIYGGINAFVIVFVFWPLAVPIARRLDKPRYIFLTIMYMGLLGPWNVAMPGSPQTGNVAAAEILGASASAAPGIGVLVTVLWTAFDIWFALFLSRYAKRKGHHFEEGAGLDTPPRDIETCPGIVRSVVPLVVLLALFIVLGNGIGPIEGMSATAAVVTANVIAMLVCLVLNRKYYGRPKSGLGYVEGMKRSVFEGVASSFSPTFTMLSMVSLAAVLSATPAFDYLINIAMNSVDNPYLQAVIATQVLGVICGSAGATTTTVCNTLGAQWLAMPGVNPDALVRIVSIGSSGCSTVPYSGGLFVNLDVTGCQIKQVWPQQLVAVAVPSVLSALLAAALASAGLVF